MNKNPLKRENYPVEFRNPTQLQPQQDKNLPKGKTRGGVLSLKKPLGMENEENHPIFPPHLPRYLLKQVLEGGSVQQSSSGRFFLGRIPRPRNVPENRRLLVIHPVPIPEIKPGTGREEEERGWPRAGSHILGSNQWISGFFLRNKIYWNGWRIVHVL